MSKSYSYAPLYVATPNIPGFSLYFDRACVNTAGCPESNLEPLNEVQLTNAKLNGTYKKKPHFRIRADL